jgi:tartrate-resistant acid phosphatase type 5
MIQRFLFACMLLAGCREAANMPNIKDDTVTNHQGFHFYVLGDWGRRAKPSQLAVAHQLLAYSKTYPPAFIVTTGDNFYQQGVASVNDPHWTRSFTNVYKELTREVDWYPTLGNHDYQRTGNPQAEIDYSTINPRWHMPSTYYTTVATTADSQRVRLVFIDSNPFVAMYYSDSKYPAMQQQDTAAQRRWIDSTLANAREEWTIVVGHHPIYSGGGEHFNTPELVTGLMPMLNKYKVQAYICGHEHNLQHLKPAGSYVDYIISGGGGDVTTPDSIAGTRYQKATAGFTDIAIRNDSLFLQFIDRGGDIIYQYARARTP